MAENVIDLKDWYNLNTAAPQHLSQEIKSEPSTPVSEIKMRLLGNLRGVLSYLLPGGVFRRNKFFVGDVQGNPGESLVVDLDGDKAGMWHDFATAEGGDIIALWAAVSNRDTRHDFPELIKSISDWLGIRSKTYYEETEDLKGKLREYESHDLDDLCRNNLLGHPTARWDYYDQNKKIIACIYRYETMYGKQYRPWDVKSCSHRAPEVRPLYNIPGIIKSRSIIIVEGEKSADALIHSGIEATTAMFGANAPLNKTDWSPLYKKQVVIWPDNDEPGFQYAKQLAEYLLPHVASLTILKPPSDKDKGWDAADAKAEGLLLQDFINQSPKDSLKRQTIAPINLFNWQKPPPNRDWVIDGWLPTGYVTAIYGDGGVGKSLLAQQLMTAVATGSAWLNFPIKQSKVYALLCEDDEQELWRRQYAINQYFDINMADLAEHLRMISRVGDDNLLMVFDGKDNGQLTPFYHELLADIKEFNPHLVVLDTAADLFGGNENNRSQVRQFIQNCCARIARAINGAVLICAHPSDSGIQRKTGTGGSTAWNNTVRSRWYFSKPSNQENSNTRILSRKKANYGPMQAEINLEWQSGVFVPTGGFSNSYLKNALIKAIEDSAIEDLPFSHTGEPGVYKQRARLPVEFHTLSRQKLEDMVTELLEEGKLIKTGGADSKEPKRLTVAPSFSKK